MRAVECTGTYLSDDSVRLQPRLLPVAKAADLYADAPPCKIHTVVVVRDFIHPRDQWVKTDISASITEITDTHCICTRYDVPYLTGRDLGQLGG